MLKIDDPQEKRGWRLWDVLLLLPVAVAIVFLPFLIVGHYKASLLDLRSSKLEKLSLAAIVYQNDFDDQFPYVQTDRSLRRVLRPYLKSEDVWKPVTDAQIRFNFNLAGV